MRIRSLTNGNEIEVSDETGAALIDAGIYELVPEPKPAKKDGPKYKRRDLSAED
jgi:hypothetical protein